MDDPSPPPQAARVRPRSSPTHPRQLATRDRSIELPDLNLDKKRCRVSPEPEPSTSKRLNIRDSPTPVEQPSSEKSKGKLPATQPDSTSKASPVKRPPSPPAVEPLSAYTCPICFSPPTYATLTPCGHVCCGECLFIAINAAMQRARHTTAVGGDVARCPVCRAHLPDWDGKGGGVIGLKPRAVFAL